MLTKIEAYFSNEAHFTHNTFTMFYNKLITNLH